MEYSRRNFIKQSFVGTILLGTGTTACTQSAEQAVQPNLTKTTNNPFHLSMAGYTFKHFDLETTLKTLQQLDVHNLCIRDFHLPYDCTEEDAKAFHAKCASYGVTGYAVGPIYMHSKEDVDRAFEYCKCVGVKMIVGVPDYDLLPLVDQKVKEYDVRVAMHLHGPKSEFYPHAKDIWDRVKDLDGRLGICLDIGHNLRANREPSDDLKEFHSRVFDMHIKDVTEANVDGHAIELGRGIIDFPKLIRTMREVNYTGMCSLEYEKDMENPFMGIAESIGYFKAVCDWV